MGVVGTGACTVLQLRKRTETWTERQCQGRGADGERARAPAQGAGGGLFLQTPAAELRTLLAQRRYTRPGAASPWGAKRVCFHNSQETEGSKGMFL